MLELVKFRLHARFDRLVELFDHSLELLNVARSVGDEQTVGSGKWHELCKRMDESLQALHRALHIGVAECQDLRDELVAAAGGAGTERNAFGLGCHVWDHFEKLLTLGND